VARLGLGVGLTIRHRPPGAAAAIAAGPIDVLVVAGQSNAYGTPDVTTVPGGYSADTNVMSWNGTSFVTYAPNTSTGLEFDSPAGAWSAELEYSRQYRIANPTKKLAIIKYTASGTQLGSTGTATNDWSTASTGEFFDKGGTQVANAIAALTAAGYTPTIRMMWWMQGEADASTGPLSAAYATNLAALVAGLRNASLSWKIPSAAPIIIGRVSLTAGDVGNSRNAVRDAQLQVCTDKVGGNQVMMDTDGLAMSGMHYQNDALITLGARLWDYDQRVVALPTADAYSPTNTELTSFLALQTNLKPNLTERQAFDAFISAGKSHGWWSKQDVVRLIASHEAQSLVLNMRQNNYHLTRVLQPVFIPKKGALGGAATIYYTSGYIPSTAGGQYVQDSASYWFYSLSDIRANSAGVGGMASTTAKLLMNPWNGTVNSIAHAINNAASANALAPSPQRARGFFGLSRTASTGYGVFQDTTKLGTQTAASNGVPDQAIRTLSDGTGSNPRRIAMEGWGAGLTDTEMTFLGGDVQTLLDALGVTWTAVIPTVGTPTITGTRTNGSVLTAVTGTVAGEPTPVTTWQWTRAGADISGATAITYTQQAADVGNIVSVRQIVTSSAGSANATAANGAATA
jgi:hypothetical protein